MTHPEDLDRYVRKLSTLNVDADRVRGVAPHKPILLPSVSVSLLAGPSVLTVSRLSSLSSRIDRTVHPLHRVSTSWTAMESCPFAVVAAAGHMLPPKPVSQSSELDLSTGGNGTRSLYPDNAAWGSSPDCQGKRVTQVLGVSQGAHCGNCQPRRSSSLHGYPRLGISTCQDRSAVAPRVAG